MTNNNKYIFQEKKLFVSIITILLMIIFLGAKPQVAHAAADIGTREQAMAAYFNLLTQNKISWGSSKIYSWDVEYAIEDINGDKLPELILYYSQAPHCDGWHRIYTYVDGKVKSLGHLIYVDISKKKNFFCDSYANCGMTEVYYYRLKNGKKVNLASVMTSDTYPSGVKKSEIKKVNNDGYPIYYYNCKVDGKKTTYKKCMNRINELRKNANYIEPYFDDNYFSNHSISSKENVSKYNGNTYFTGYTYIDEAYPNVYRVNSSGTRKMLQYDAHIQKRRNQYLYTEDNYGDFGVSDLYVVNGNNGKIKRLTAKSNGTVITTKKYAFYPVFSKYEYDSIKFKIYRCKLSGSNKKAITDTITAKSIVKITSEYVQYKKGSNQYRYYYDSGNVKKVDNVNPSVKITGGSTGGTSCTLTATTVPTNASVKWSSSNTSVATVSGGKVTAKGAGTTTIKASITYNNKTYSASKTITVVADRIFGSWSNWTTNSISASSTREVRTTKLYRYYYYYCPRCGGREPFTGTSDCHNYTLSGSDWHEGWFTTSYANCSPKSYSYTTSKKYTESLGDGKRWNFSSGNLNDTAVGTKDADSSAVVIKTGYSSRSVSISYKISEIK